METIPVTLIVKAPNQQIEDQTVKCELSWTIQKLKQHLSEVYPSKPPKHEQKLIYSGQLLPDSVILKDILRQYDGQEAHTVHLVCATRQNTQKQKPVTAGTTSQPIPTPSPATENTRIDPSAQQSPPEMQWPQFAPMDANQYAQHMAYMHHAYMQYMSQYMNLSTVGTPNPNGAAYLRRNVAAPNNQNREQNVEPPEAAGRQREPENPERDWLDVFYTIMRLMIFMSVVYVYSSPLRFLTVFCLGTAIYFYHMGFFRNLNNNNNHNNNNNVRDEQENPEVHSPSVLMVVLTFFTSFISSLIPDIPQAV